MAWLRLDLVSFEVGSMGLPMKAELTTVMADDGIAQTSFSCLKALSVELSHLARADPGETLDLVQPDRTMTTFYVILLLESIVFGSAWLGGPGGGVTRHLTHRRRRVSEARCIRVSVLDV